MNNVLEKTRATKAQLTKMSDQEFIAHLRKYLFNSQWHNKTALAYSYLRYNQIKTIKHGNSLR